MEIKRKLEEQRRMQRIWKIYEHPLFIEGLVKNKDAEKERIFCHHDMNHFLDVARLMYIFSMERGYAFGKEEIYATALLHDIGKWQQKLQKGFWKRLDLQRRSRTGFFLQF